MLCSIIELLCFIPDRVEICMKKVDKKYFKTQGLHAHPAFGSHHRASRCEPIDITPDMEH